MACQTARCKGAQAPGGAVGACAAPADATFKPGSVLGRGTARMTCDGAATRDAAAPGGEARCGGRVPMRIECCLQCASSCDTYSIPSRVRSSPTSRSRSGALRHRTATLPRVGSTRGAAHPGRAGRACGQGGGRGRRRFMGAPPGRPPCRALSALWHACRYRLSPGRCGHGRRAPPGAPAKAIAPGRPGAPFCACRDRPIFIQPHSVRHTGAVRPRRQRAPPAIARAAHRAQAELRELRAPVPARRHLGAAEAPADARQRDRVLVVSDSLSE